MSVFELKDYSYRYPKSRERTLDNISLEISEGEFVVVCGESGCGKTTLLRQMKTCLTPAGEIEGRITFFGRSLAEVPDREQTGRIGFVMQDVENQIVTDKVWHELAFGLESLGCKTDEIRKRVAEMAGFFGIEGWFRKSVTELSGGQKQLLNLASVMVMSPDVLILDEPTAQLDPIAAESFINMLRKLNSETGITIIISEHRAEEVLEICSRVIVMERGHIICDDTPANTAAKMLGENAGTDACTAASRIYAGVDGSGAFPVSVNEGRAMLRNYPQVSESGDNSGDTKPVAAELKNVRFRYEKDMPDVIRGVSLQIYKGEILALLGGNGTGKTTLMSLISGANRPYRGRVVIKEGSELIGAVPQDPRLLFVKKTLIEDLMEMLEGMSYDERRERAEAAAALCGLTDRLGIHPYDLSGGEQQRAAIAKVLLKDPQILLLDEPTKGMDMKFKRRLAAILKSLAEHGRTIFIVSHDIEFCAMYCDRCAMLFDGEISAVGDTKEFFLQNRLYTTAARRISRGIIENAVTVEDVIFACTGKKDEPEETGIDDSLYYRRKPVREKKESRLKKYFFGEIPQRVGARKAPLPGRTKLAALMLLLFVPLTVFAGVFYFGDKRYYFTSLLVIIESTLPFMLIYERKKPKPRELVTIAALCAIAVAGRAVFYFLPHFKPITAMVMIAGIAFGGEAGFLVGAMSAFVSNFFFGQGAWTPWQMFAFGLIGFLAGEVFKGGIRGRLPAAMFGFWTVFLLYGGIMNFANVTMSQPEVTREALIASYASGIPLDLIHAVSTFIFLWIAAVPMLEKLDRIKVKYALI